MVALYRRPGVLQAQTESADPTNGTQMPGGGVQERFKDAAEFLRANRNSDGGWGYLPGNASAPEPTCYAALATGGGPEAVAWISRNAGAQWTKSLALLTLHQLRSAEDVQQRLKDDLLAVKVKQLRSGDMIELDGSLRGWAWVDDTFSWVEPTSYALLALKKAGTRQTPRVQEAERLLLNRACADGGWNYGNRKVRGLELGSMIPATALAAMALQHVPPAAAKIARALDLLDNECKRTPSSMGLALSVLCFDISLRPSTHLVEALLSRQRSDGSWRGQVHLTGLSVLALQAVTEKKNVFRVS